MPQVFGHPASVFPAITSVILDFINMEKRISIYIDGANFVYGLKSLHPKYSDYHFDFENYVKMIVGKNQLVDIFYYNASLKQDVNPRRFKEQQKLLARLRKMPKCKIILCKRQKKIRQRR